MIKRFDIYNESVKDKMTPRTEEEISRNIESTIINTFEKILETGHGVHTYLDWFSPDMKKYIDKYVITYKLMDQDYYTGDYEQIALLEYKDTIFRMKTIVGGDYYTVIYKIKESKQELIDKLEKVLGKLR